MSDFPSSPAFSSPTPDVATGVPRLEAWLKATKQGIGRGLQSLTIASGLITPADGVTGSIKVDTESAASTDDLANLAQTNIPDGHYVMLQITDNARAVVVKHNAGGTGDIELTGSLDFQMNRTEQRLLLQRSGSTWVEVMRSGREKQHDVGGSGEPSYQNSWAVGLGAAQFWKDELGLVHLLGGASKTNPGAGPEVIYTLPAGYRPAVGVAGVCPALLGLSFDSEINLVLVGTNGDVSWQRPAGDPGTGGQTIFFSLPPFRAVA